MKCWAGILGDCGGGQSKEHYLTKALYPNNVKADGLPWSKGESVTLPGKCLSANILCKRHNERLSVVDAEAKRMRDFLAQALKEASSPKHRKPVTVCNLDWGYISRWFSKLVCNLEFLRGHIPDERFVRHAFGQPCSTVAVYVDRMAYPQLQPDGDATNILFRPWPCDLRSGEQTAVYVLRFAIFEWLIAPFHLTPGDCNTLARDSGDEHWFRATPVERRRVLPIDRKWPDGRIERTHKLILSVRGG